jgi:hypothetical protein
MASAASGIFMTIAGGNYNFPLTGLDVASSTQCQVTSEILYGNTSGSIYVEPAWRQGATMGTDGNIPCYVPQPATYASCTTSWVFPVTSNTAYDFGCWLSSTNASNQVYCTVSVVCF